MHRFLFESPQPFVPLSSEGSSPDESISCQIRLLQPIFNQRAASEYGIVEDAELAPKLKKARRPKVPASGKVTLKRRTAANVTGSNKKLKAAS